MTTDTDPLEDRLWDAIFEARDLPGKTGEASTMSIVEAILPIIAAEVRAAKAEALRDAAENVDVGSLADAWTHGGITRLSVTNAVAEVLLSLRNRATEYETGDQR